MGKVYAIFFSATGNTKKSVMAMAQGAADALGRGEALAVEAIDVTCEAAPAPRAFGPDDAVIIGMPVYAGRIPLAVRDRLTVFTGQGTRCLVAASYGNRHYDDAVLELADMAAEQGFDVKGGAALIGRHTYGEIQVDRPDAADLDQSRAFAAQAILRDSAPAIPGSRPYREGMLRGKFHPLTSDACVKCGLCAKRCPMKAIGEDFRTVSDACISCFRCIRSCPKGAKNMDVPAYNEFAAKFTDMLKARRDNEFF